MNRVSHSIADNHTKETRTSSRSRRRVTSSEQREIMSSAMTTNTRPHTQTNSDLEYTAPIGSGIRSTRCQKNLSCSPAIAPTRVAAKSRGAGLVCLRTNSSRRDRVGAAVKTQVRTEEGNPAPAALGQHCTGPAHLH
jgi:hypothetical protein